MIPNQKSSQPKASLKRRLLALRLNNRLTSPGSVRMRRATSNSPRIDLALGIAPIWFPAFVVSGESLVAALVAKVLPAVRVDAVDGVGGLLLAVALVVPRGCVFCEFAADFPTCDLV